MFTKPHISYKLQKTLYTWESPIVMGIINLSPDSFFEQSVNSDLVELLKNIELMISGGASIIDIGAVSTRPYAAKVSLHEEWSRIKPFLSSIRKTYPNIAISLDTTKATIAEKALDLGIEIINDVSGLSDPDMIPVLSKYDCAYILTHIQGTPQDMQDDPNYKHLGLDLLSFFKEKLNMLNKANIHQVIIDPGIGFGKSLDQNFEIISSLEIFKIFDKPVLLGLSRKSMIYKHLSVTPEEALNGTTAAHMYALTKGADILRVHDVIEAKQCVKLFNKLRHN